MGHRSISSSMPDRRAIEDIERKSGQTFPPSRIIMSQPRKRERNMNNGPRILGDPVCVWRVKGVEGVKGASGKSRESMAPIVSRVRQGSQLCDRWIEGVEGVSGGLRESRESRKSKVCLANQVS